MSAFIVFHSTIKDVEKFQVYARSVGATLRPFEGEVIQRGIVADVLAGDHSHQAIGILRFKSLVKAHRWYQSADYQALIPNRDDAANLTVISYEEPSA